jgi:hypothetical protein
VAAAEVRGSNLRFSNLKVIGFGTKGARECFPLFMLAPALSATRPAPMRNVLVENCIFQDPAATNPDGVTVVAIVGQGSGSLINAIVRGCTVTGVGSHFAYSHAFGANHIENCVVEDCGFATYFEPDPALGTSSIGPVLIRSNLFLNVSFGVSVDSHPGGRFDALTCIGNEMVLRGSGTAGYGLRICDVCGIGPTSSITNLTVLNNVVRYPNWEVRPGALDGGLMYGDIRHAVYANNIVALGISSPLRVRSYPAGLIPDVPEPEDCDHPRLVVPGPSAIPPSLDLLPPGYRRAWYNNRDLSGLLLPVRFLHSGVDRNASQQQWPE